jgi:predicted CXXCH cytochrome family protein
LTCTQCHKGSTGIGFVGFTGSNTHWSTPEFYDQHAGKPLSCTSTCHGPHGTQFQYMMVGFPWYLDGLCLQCHPGVGIRY